MIIKNLKRGDVVSIDWINAVILMIANFMGHSSLDMLLKKIRAFHRSNEKRSDLKIRLKFKTYMQLQDLARTDFLNPDFPLMDFLQHRLITGCNL